MITLFHRPRSRSSRFIFLLEELEAPYEVRVVTTRSRDGTGAVARLNIEASHHKRLALEKTLGVVGIVQFQKGVIKVMA